MQEGDIYFVEIPASNGHEQAGLRPAIIIQLRAIDKKRLKNKLGKISLNKLKLIKNKICELMGLSGSVTNG